MTRLRISRARSRRSTTIQHNSTTELANCASHLVTGIDAPNSRTNPHNLHNVNNPTTNPRLAPRKLAHHQHRRPRPRILLQLPNLHPAPRSRSCLPIRNPTHRPANPATAARRRRRGGFAGSIRERPVWRRGECEGGAFEDCGGGAAGR